MGLIKAAIGSVGGVLADQWKEFFYCDSLNENILMAKGQKRTSRHGRSGNTDGEDNIISNGSRIAVNNGQCMLIVESGKIVEVCAEPGEYTYDASTEASIFDGDYAGDLGESFRLLVRQMKERFAFGGDTGKDQRVYYVNLKEIIGNKYGTPSEVPFKSYDDTTGLALLMRLRCFGEYSYRIVNPILFYTNVAGNDVDVYERSRLDSQLKSELLTALQPAFARISALHIDYSQLPGHTPELAARQAAQAPSPMPQAAPAGSWTCACGQSGNTGNFCTACGRPKPQTAAAWTCPKCGQAGNTGNFCSNCGAPRPQVPANWTCPSCGTVNTGNFCMNCGAKKPER